VTTGFLKYRKPICNTDLLLQTFRQKMLPNALYMANISSLYLIFLLEHMSSHGSSLISLRHLITKTVVSILQDSILLFVDHSIR